MNMNVMKAVGILISGIVLIIGLFEAEHMLKRPIKVSAKAIQENGNSPVRRIHRNEKQLFCVDMGMAKLVYCVLISREVRGFGSDNAEVEMEKDTIFLGSLAPEESCPETLAEMERKRK